MKKQIGKVVSNKMINTVVVEREISRQHPKYKKIMRRNRTIKAHTNESFNIGDMVEYQSCRPISKQKHYKVIAKINNQKS